MKRVAFTLIELILYIALTAIIVVSLTHVMIAILETRDKTEKVDNLQYGVRFALDRISERAFNAKDIDTKISRFGKKEGILALQMRAGEPTPAVFSLQDGRVFLAQAQGEPEPLTPRDVQIQTLRFWNRSLATGQQDLIGIEISGIDLSSKTGSSSVLSLQTSVSLRQ